MPSKRSRNHELVLAETYQIRAIQSEPQSTRSRCQLRNSGAACWGNSRWNAIPVGGNSRHRYLLHQVFRRQNDLDVGCSIARADGVRSTRIGADRRLFKNASAGQVVAQPLTVPIAMPYTAEISRSNPSAFLFLIDQSGSMQEVLSATDAKPLDRPISVDGQTFTHQSSGRTKAQAVSDAINRLLRELTLKCAKSDGVRDYYHVGVIGYGGGNTASRVAPAFGGSLAGRELAPISEVADSPTRIEERSKKEDDGAGGLVERKIRFPVWFEAVAEGGTPMCAALQRAKTILSDWVTKYPSGFPPICINISDGASTDGDPSVDASALTSLSTTDGRVLLFNLHLSAAAGRPVEFADSDAALPDDSAKLLFRMSSLLPAHMQAFAKQEGLHVTEESRGFAFNADLVALIRFLDIGTRPSNLR